MSCGAAGLLPSVLYYAPEGAEASRRNCSLILQYLVFSIKVYSLILGESLYVPSRRRKRTITNLKPKRHIIVKSLCDGVKMKSFGRSVLPGGAGE